MLSYRPSLRLFSRRSFSLSKDSARLTVVSTDLSGFILRSVQAERHVCAVIDVRLSQLSRWHCEESDCGNALGRVNAFLGCRVAAVLRLVDSTHVLIGFTEQTKGSCTCQESE